MPHDDHSAVLRVANPWTIMRHHWRSVLQQTWSASSADNIGLIAAGTAFWGFAAIAPLLAATVLSYGIFASPETVDHNIRALFGALPRDAATLIADQLTNVVGTSGSKKGLGLLLSLALALYGGMQGASAIITALNIAYEEQETRGLLEQNLLALFITIVGVVVVIAATLSTAAIGFLGALLPQGGGLTLMALRLCSYGILAVVAATAGALLYRFGPNRSHAKWRWITPGSLLATAMWLMVTGLFAYYVAKFGNYGATYGSLSAVIVLQLWLWLSAYLFLLGAELNSQLEQRTGFCQTKCIAR